MNPALDRFVHWLDETTRGRVALWLLERAAFAIGAMITLWCVYTIETRFVPVITNWTLDYVERSGDRIIVGGQLHKSRPCELISTSVLAVPKAPLVPRQLIFQVKPGDLLGGNAPTGTSTWGPWTMPIPKALVQHRQEISYLEVVGTHRCHALWSQETLYGTVSIDAIP